MTSTMRRYANALKLLDDLAGRAIAAGSADPVGLPASVKTALGEERLAAAMGKLRANSVARRIEIETCRSWNRGGRHGGGFSKRQPLISSYRTGRPVSGARAGWQVQGAQFRLAVVAPHLGGQKVPAITVGQLEEAAIAFARKVGT